MVAALASMIPAASNFLTIKPLHILVIDEKTITAEALPWRLAVILTQTLSLLQLSRSANPCIRLKVIFPRVVKTKTRWLFRTDHLFNPPGMGQGFS
jgi:hypothetical protein